MNRFTDITVDYLVGERDGLYATVEMDGDRIKSIDYPCNGGTEHFDHEDREWCMSLDDRIITAANKRLAKGDVCPEAEGYEVIAEVTKKFRLKGKNIWVPVTATMMAWYEPKDEE